MAIVMSSEYPKLNWIQRFFKWLVGGQDVAVIILVTENTRRVFWLSGVDMEKPIDIEGLAGETAKTHPI